MSARDEQARFEREFRAALAKAIEGTGLHGRFIPPDPPSTELPVLFPPAGDGWYVIGCVLEIGGDDFLTGRTVLNAVYRSDESGQPGQGEYPVDLRLSGPTARDAAFLASALVTKILGHAAARTPGARPAPRSRPRPRRGQGPGAARQAR
jgi:hypothetical protein